MAEKKYKDVIRARKTRSRKIQNNINALHVLLLTEPIPVEILDILLELTDAGLRTIRYAKEKVAWVEEKK